MPPRATRHPATPPRRGPAPAAVRPDRRTRRRRAGEVITSLAALVALIAFLGGVPLLLWTWRGYPLPTTFQPGRWWQLLLAGYIHPDVLPNAIATASWLLWAWLALCLAWEAITQIATASRRPGPRTTASPGRGASTVGRPAITAGRGQGAGGHGGAPAPRAVRHGAARWIATASVAITLLSSRAALAATPTGPPATGQAIATTAVTTTGPQDLGDLSLEDWFTLAPTATATASATGGAGAATPTVTLHPATGRCTVAPGQTLWSIAADAYPDATLAQLPAAVDAVFAANLGTPDPAGRRLVHPSLINPGMVLTLPTIDLTATAPAVPDQPAGVASRPDPGNRTTTGPSVLSPVTSPPATPATVSPTPQLTRPPSPTPGVSASPAQSTPVAPHTPEPPTNTPKPTGQRPPAGHTADGRYRFARALAAGLSGGLLAAAVVAAVAYRRRRRDATVTPDTAPPPPTPDAAALHTALLATTSQQDTQRIDHALRALADLHTVPGGEGGPLPQVVLARSTGTLDVYLRDPIPDPPPPWEADAHGQVWTLPTDATLPDVDTGLPPPCPAFVQLGHETDGAAVYADLEALGTLTLDTATHGPAALQDLARALLATLALSPLAVAPTIRTYGLHPDGLAAEDRVHPADSLDDLLTATAAEIGQLRADLEAVAPEADTTFEARATTPTDNWEPTIALIVTPSADDTESDQLTDLALLATPGGGLAVIGPATSDHQPHWRLTLLDGPANPPSPTDDPASGARDPDPDDFDDDDPTGDRGGLAAVADLRETANTPRWRLDPLGLVLTPITLAAAELRALSDLLSDVARPPIAVPALPSTPSPKETAPTGQAPMRQDESPQPWMPLLPPAPGAVMPMPDVAHQEVLASVPAERAADQTPPYREPDWQIMARLYGPPAVTSRTGRQPTGEPGHPRILEVLAWLTTHRNHTRDALENALWDTRPEHRTLNNKLSLVRRLLVQLAGEHARAWLPNSRSVLRLDLAVTTDLALLEHRLDYAHAHRSDPDSAIPVLDAALDLVIGTPATYGWLEAELGSALTATAVRAALLLAELHLDRDESGKALAATRRGLAVHPAHPGLFATRLRAHAAAGDLAAVTAEYHSYLRAEQADPDSTGDTDTDLAHLHRQLTTRTATTSVRWLDHSRRGVPR